MKVNLEDVRIGISAFNEECQIGVMDTKNSNAWKHKINAHNDFIHAVVTCWGGKKQTVTQDGYKYEISVKKTKI